MPIARTDRAAVRAMAAACGLTVANLYYAQPLLDLISRDFGVSHGAASLVVTFTQIGYAVGLLFVLPVGDLLENRTLVTRVLIGTALACALAAASPDFAVFAAASVLLGITSVVAQILVPLAAHLASEENRGTYVGRVMGGLLLGILLARTVASLLSDWLGWRSIFVLSAVAMLVLAVTLRRTLPSRRPDHAEGYGSLLRSVGALVRDEPVLRARALCQGAMFGAFTAFWTAIAYELISEHGLGQTQIAIFALVGAGGAAAAPVAGKLADSGFARPASAVAYLLGAASFVLAGSGHGSVVLLAVAGVVLDFAVQSHHVLGQHQVYALRADARARINTVYMTTVFTGGAIASAVTGVVYTSYGWTGVCGVGSVLPLLALAIWAVRLSGRMSADASAEFADA